MKNEAVHFSSTLPSTQLFACVAKIASGNKISHLGRFSKYRCAIILGMRRTVFSVGAMSLVALPQFVFAAGLVPCGGPNEPSCQFCHVAQLLSNINTWLVQILSILLPIILVVGGLILVTSVGNVQRKGLVRKIIANAIVGFIIVVAAWFIVDFVLKALVTTPQLSGPWNSIQCAVQP